MRVNVLNEVNSVLNQYIREIRDSNIQKDRERFRRNMEKCGFLLAFEISKSLDFNKIKLQTPLKSAEENIISDQLVLACILRASLPFYNGFLNAYPNAESGFVGAARKHSDPVNFEIQADYFAFPSIEGKSLILIDPMLATGKSMVEVINHLCQKERPQKLIISSLIATAEACSYLEDKIKIPFEIYTAALDPELTTNFYISPGLGDAGDLAFGPKV